MPMSKVNRSVVNTPEIKPITTEREPIKKKTLTIIIIINYDDNKNIMGIAKQAKFLADHVL